MHEFKRKFPPAPSDWQRKKFGEIVDRLTSRNVERHENVLTISAELGLISQSEYFGRRVASESVVNYFLLVNGDFAYNKSYSRGYPLGVIRRLDRYEKGCVSPLYICFRPRADEVNTDFLLHYVDGGALDEGLANIAKEGVRNHGLLNVGVLDFLSLEVSLPPIAEQRKLAQVLDTIDTTIHETEAIIEKLKQVTQGLLYDLLTRGIDANGELRPPQSQAPQLYKHSPLGWIPKQWNVARISNIASLVTSGSRGWADHYAESGALFLRSQNVRMGKLDFSDRQHVQPPSGAEGERTKIAGGDVLITITGNGVGNVAYVPAGWNELAFVSQHVGLVRLYEPLLSQLTMHYLVEGAPGNQQLIDAQYGQSKPGLSLDSLRNLLVPIPPDNEKQMIVDRIRGAQVRGAAERRYATQLRAMKVGLMNDLLTGRVRVNQLLGATGT